MNHSVRLLILAASALALVGAAASQGTTGGTTGTSGAVHQATAYLTEDCADLATSTGTGGTTGTGNGTGTGTGGSTGGTGTGTGGTGTTGTGSTANGCLSPATLRVPAGHRAVRLTLVNNGTEDVTVDVCAARAATGGGSTGSTGTTNGTGGTGTTGGTGATNGTGTGGTMENDLVSFPATVPGGESVDVCITLEAGTTLSLILADSGTAIGTVTSSTTGGTTGTGGTGTGTGGTGAGGNGTGNNGGAQESTDDNDAPGPGVLLVLTALGVAMAALTLRRK